MRGLRGRGWKGRPARGLGVRLQGELNRRGRVVGELPDGRRVERAPVRSAGAAGVASSDFRPTTKCRRRLTTRAAARAARTAFAAGESPSRATSRPTTKSSARTPDRRRSRRRSRRLRLLDGGDVEDELDLVADEHVAAAQRLVELHAVVAALELAGDLEADALVAPRVDVGALDLGLERRSAGDAVQRQVAGDAERLLVDGLDRVDAKRDVRDAARRRRSRPSAGARRAAPRWCPPTRP